MLNGRYDEALSDCTRAIELNPQYAWAIGTRGNVYRTVGRYEDALSDHTRAIELNTQVDWALTERAQTYRLMGRYDEALSDYTRAIELNPQTDWVISARAATHLCMGRYVNAVVDCARAVELDPEDARNRRLYAVALSLSAGEEAGAHLQAAIQTYTSIAAGEGPAAMSARGDLLVAYCTIPDWDRATAQLEDFLSDGPAMGLIHDVQENLSFFQELLPEMRSGMGSITTRLQEVLGLQN